MSTKPVLISAQYTRRPVAAVCAGRFCDAQKMAQRIRARAIRRAGELLKQVEPQRGARTDMEPSAGGDTRLTRKQAATDAGMPPPAGWRGEL